MPQKNYWGSLAGEAESLISMDDGFGLFALRTTIKPIPDMIIAPPATVRQSSFSLSTNIPKVTATTGVTRAISIVLVTSMFRTSQ